jgi:hypothetical protein
MTKSVTLAFGARFLRRNRIKTPIRHSVPTTATPPIEGRDDPVMATKKVDKRPPTTPAISDSERLAELRRLLSSGPSSHAFNQIMMLFFHWPRNEVRKEALSEANQKLSSWPDKLRTTLASRYVDGKEVGDWAVLVRSIVIYRSEQNGPSDIARVTRSPFLSESTQFSILRCELPTAYLARSVYLRSLTLLRISNTVILDPEFKELFASPTVEKLTHLDLNEHGLHNWNIEFLTTSKFAPHLCELVLTNCSLDNECAQTLAQASHMTALTLLDLRHNYIREEGKLALKNAKHLKHTQILF